MPEMLLPMFLLEPFDPTQIAFGSQCGRNDRFRPQIGPYARFRTLSSQFSYPPRRIVVILPGRILSWEVSGGPKASS
jgi:hypothetical protein